MATVNGDAGNNSLYGTTGDDTIYGYGGYDQIYASSGTDYIDGGDGTDRLWVTISNATLFTAPTGSRTYTITSTSITDSSGSLNTTFTGIERVYLDTRSSGDFGDTIDASGFVSTSSLALYLGAGNDTVIASAGNDTISLGLGHNTLDAGAGYDTAVVEVDSSSAVVYVTGSGGTFQTSRSGVLTNSVSNVESIRIASADYNAPLTHIDASGLLGFTGLLIFSDNNGTNISIGSAGADIFANNDNNIQGNDVYTGNGGADTFDYTVAIDAMDGDTITDFDWDDIIDIRYNDSSWASQGYETAELFIGTAAFNGVVGEYRYEIVGDQTLVQVDTTGDGVADETLTIANGGFGLAETFAGSNVLQLAGNRVTGDANANSLTGTAGIDLIDGLAGADTMTGLGGDDIYYVDNVGDRVTEASGGGDDRVNSTVSHTLGAHVEMLTLTGVRAINGTGNALANTLAGNSARNILNGLGGADTMSGGGGNDLYIVNHAGDVVTENADQGIDRVNSLVSYTLTANVENLMLTGTAATSGTGNGLNNIITGNGAANTLTGGGGNDTLNGGAGVDTMVGGAGNDTYIVANAGDAVTEAAAAGNDLVRSGISYTLGANVERLVLTGTDAISGTGNGLSNTIIGNGAANVLRGGSGSDVIAGGAGDDDLYGGLSVDILTGGLGADDFFFDTAVNGVNVDKIKDFSAAADTIKLDLAVFSGLAGAGTLAAGAFRAGTAAADADDRIIYDSATGKLYYDADGNGAGAQMLFATLNAGTAITNADFIAY